jgi:hypothetical protein
MRANRLCVAAAALGLAVCPSSAITPSTTSNSSTTSNAAADAGGQEDVMATPATAAPPVSVRHEGDRVWIDGLHPHRGWMTLPTCLHDCAAAQGMEVSRAWLYGSTGFAFALNIHEVICPSGPTAWNTRRCLELAANIGLPTRRIQAHKTQEDFAAVREQAFEAAKAAIDEGRPCVLWEADIPEWYTVVGYDNRHLLFFAENEIKSIHHLKLADTGIGWLNLWLPKVAAPADDRQIVRDALQFALDHAAGEYTFERYAAGPAGYDLWIAALQRVPVMEEVRATAFGQGYNAQCWAECRQMAVAFLEEARQRLNDSRLDSLFDAAIADYRAVAAALTRVAELTPFSPPEDEAALQRLQDESLRGQLIAALQESREAEARGLADLKQLLAALNPATQRQRAAAIEEADTGQ